MNRNFFLKFKQNFSALLEKFYLSLLKSPGFWIFIFFALGIAGSSFLKNWILFSFFLLSVVILFLRQILPEQKEFFLSLFLLFCFSFLGGWLYQIKTPSPPRELLGQVSPDALLRIKAKLVGIPQNYAYYSRVLCRLVWWNQGEGFKKGSGYFWLNYPGEESFYPGDEVLALVKIKPLKRFSNFLLPDTLQAWEKAGIYFSARKISPAPILKVKESKIPFFHWLEQIRKHLARELERSGAPARYLLFALLLGEREALPVQVNDAFKSLGVSHILVVSGLHLSLVGGFSFLLIFSLLRFFPPLIKRYDIYPLCGILSIFPITFYALLSGFRLPTIRAWIMIVILFLALIFYRRRYLLNSLGWAGIIILLFRPASLFAPGFQFSFLAVFALIIYFPSIWKILGGEELGKRAQLIKLEPGNLLSGLKWLGVKSAEYLYGLFLASILIQLFCLPLQIYYFSQLSAFAPLLNLGLIPVCGFWVLPLGLLALTSGLFSPALAGFFYQLSGLGALVMEKMVSFFARIPKASFLIRPLDWKETLSWYLLLMLVLYFFTRPGEKRELKKLKKEIYLWALGISFSLFLLIIFSRPVSEFRLKPERVRVSLLDVGMGQSIIIELPGNKTILLDGGGRLGKINLGEMVVSRALLVRGVKELEAVVLSHPELDHSYGLEYILRHFPVKEFWLSRKFNQNSLKLLELAEKRKIKIKWISCDTPAVEISGARFQFLHPCEEELSRLNLNDSSLVLGMDYQGWKILFPGDISARIEKKLFKKYPEKLPSQFLVAPHHGSGKSSSLEFLKAVSPEIILISTRAGIYPDLPSPDALKRMKKSGAKILRTDYNGEIDLILSPDRFRLNTSRLFSF